MSDCFDHAADAGESYINEYLEGTIGEYDYSTSPAIDDEVGIEIDEIVHETEKAVLVRESSTSYWIPKSQLLGYEDNTLFVTRWIFNRLPRST